MRLVPPRFPLFVFEALGSLACGFYGNYVFFLFRDRHGFGNLGNLGVAALLGLVIALASWRAGKFAQQRGCYHAMFAGLAGMMAALAVGAFFPSLPVQLAVLVLWAASQFMVWPALEALVTEGALGAVRAHIVGIYSVVWAACSAMSYFFGGAVFEWLGSESIFWLPQVFHLLQILILLACWLSPAHPRYQRLSESLKDKFPASIRRRASCLLWRPFHANSKLAAQTSKQQEWPMSIFQTASHSIATDVPIRSKNREASHAGTATGLRRSARSFQRMAWLANPFACVAAFTLLAMIPELARSMGLSTTMAGLFCSIWFFARLAAFVVMWRWPGWQYRFGWLLSGYLLLILGFTTVLTSEGLLVLAAGQVAFGLAVGVLYYASLFYSMDVGEARAEQGGIHEAMMGAGNFVGPGIGMLSLLIAPQTAHASVWAVSGVLVVGLAVLLGNRLKGGT